jgi:hypothetical protein
MDSKVIVSKKVISNKKGHRRYYKCKFRTIGLTNSIEEYRNLKCKDETSERSEKCIVIGHDYKNYRGFY